MSARKLTDKQVKAVFSMNQKGYADVEIAEYLNVGGGTISRILNGERYKDCMPESFNRIVHHVRKTDRDKEEMIKRYREELGWRVVDIARLYKISTTQVYKIIKR